MLKFWAGADRALKRMKGEHEIRRRALIISDKPDVERDFVAEAWQARGGEVLRLGRLDTGEWVVIGFNAT